MSKLKLSVAFGDYDRVRPLLDGTVQIDGVDPVFMTLGPEEIFFRAFRHAEFDICELSLSSFTLKTSLGECPYVGVPVFLSRAFRHSGIYIRTDRGIAMPANLKGRQIGIPEYQVTAAVWIRAFLEEDYGIQPSDVVWVRGGIEEPDRPEKIKIDLPPQIRINSAPAGVSLARLLADGAIDAMISPRAPSCFTNGHPNVGWLFPEPMKESKAYFQRTGIFPIMHLLGVRREIAQTHPWLPAAALKAFTQAKSVAMRQLEDTSASKITLLFADEQLYLARKLMGADFWPYGYEANEAGLDVFLRHHHAQGLSSRRLSPKELFHPATLESPKI
jgi:4,5-dihydroxyphthalate decarboxylase